MNDHSAPDEYAIVEYPHHYPATNIAEFWIVKTTMAQYPYPEPGSYLVVTFSMKSGGFRSYYYFFGDDHAGCEAIYHDMSRTPHPRHDVLYPRVIQPGRPAAVEFHP